MEQHTLGNHLCRLIQSRLIVVVVSPFHPIHDEHGRIQGLLAIPQASRYRSGDLVRNQGPVPPGVSFPIQECVT